MNQFPKILLISTFLMSLTSSYLSFTQSKPIVLKKLKKIFENDFLMEQIDQTDEFILNLKSKNGDFENQGEISYEKQRSALKDQVLGKITFKCTHSQIISETIYDFDENELNLIDDILRESYKRVCQEEINIEDKQNRIFVSLPSTIIFQIRKIFQEFEITKEVKNGKIYLNLYSDKILVMKITIQIKNGLKIVLKADFFIPSIKNKGMILQVFSRDPKYMENNVKKFYEELNMKQYLNNSMEVLESIHKYLKDQDLDFIFTQSLAHEDSKIIAQISREDKKGTLIKNYIVKIYYDAQDVFNFSFENEKSQIQFKFARNTKDAFQKFLGKQEIHKYFYTYWEHVNEAFQEEFSQLQTYEMSKRIESFFKNIIGWQVYDKYENKIFQLIFKEFKEEIVLVFKSNDQNKKQKITIKKNEFNRDKVQNLIKTNIILFFEMFINQDEEIKLRKDYLDTIVDDSHNQFQN